MRHIYISYTLLFLITLEHYLDVIALFFADGIIKRYCLTFSSIRSIR